MKDRDQEVLNTPPEYMDRYNKVAEVVAEKTGKYNKIALENLQLLQIYSYIERTPGDIRVYELGKLHIDEDNFMQNGLLFAPVAIQKNYISQVAEKLKRATEPLSRAYTNIPLTPEPISPVLKNRFLRYSDQIEEAYQQGTRQGINEILTMVEDTDPLLPELRYSMLKNTPWHQQVFKQLGGEALDVKTKIPGVYARYTYEFTDDKKQDIRNLPKLSLWVMPLSTSPRR